jgi:hypothetical protein
MHPIPPAPRFIRRNIAMPGHVAFCVLCLLLGDAFAATVYKWTDEKGTVHYGDDNNRTANSKQLSISEPAPSNSNNKPIAGTTANTTPPTGAKTLSAPEASNVQKCLSLARVMVEKKNSTPDEIRSDSKQLLGLCPGISYACTSYVERPEGNNCRAVLMRADGHITTNNTYRR